MREVTMPYGLSNALRLTGRDLVFFARYARRRIRRDTAPIVLCISYPKSGTHLLYQILSAIPGLTRWNDTVSVQSLSGVVNTASHIRWKLGSAPSGSVVRAHFTYSPEILDILGEREYRRLFIYRDLRDVVVSHAKWVQQHPRYFLTPIYLDRLTSDHDRLITSIVGIPIGWPLGSNASQPNIAQDFGKFRGWIDDPDTLAVRFEDLVGSRGGGDDARRYATVRRILEHLGVSMPDAEIESRFSVAALDPTQMVTFRVGQIGGWCSAFGPEHRAAFESVAGPLLAELGYADV